MYLSPQATERSSASSTRTFRIVNVALHALNVHLLASLARYELNFGHRHTLMMALYFATHPIHTEAIASIVGRADVLCSVFFLLTLLSFLRALRYPFVCKEMILSLTISSLSAAMALLSKETGITVLPLCIIYYVIKAPQRFAAVSESKSIRNGHEARFQGKLCERKASNLCQLAWKFGPLVVPVITVSRDSLG